MELAEVTMLANTSGVSEVALYDMMMTSLPPEVVNRIKAAAARAVLRHPYAFFPATHQSPRPMLRLHRDSSESE